MQIKRARAAVLAQSREPLVVDEIELPDALDAGQVLVRVLYTTICGAQINEIDALKGPDRFLPHLLGHEASAEVVEIGPGVTAVKPGDTVVLHWRPSRGIQSRTPAYKWRGEKLNAGWVTTFNQYAVVSENRMTPIAAGFDLRVAPLLGCAVTTAAGVVNNDAHLKVGESVAVFGAGGVGLNVVQFAALAGGYPIVAVDLLDHKLDMAKARGATHTINSRGMGAGEVADEIRAIVGRDGPDKIIETTGVKSVIENAYELTHKDGSLVLVGVPHEKVTINTLRVHFNMVLTGSEGGSSKPDIDIPRIVRLVQAGRLSFDGIITDEFGLDEINAAFDLVRSGNAGRVLVRV
ncbi:MAG: zinc-binding dehydrogenase [Alphaproteobacteria bacterium]|nr:zinc-binding dehydrogenase [Alphaproteobacteria bacterium]